LPGEAQQIERILEKFAVHYYKQNSDSVFSNSGSFTSSSYTLVDAAWALAYAVIMLNTDAHNPQVKKKMSKQQFIHNCRGINDEEDFPEDYLGELFDRIVLVNLFETKMKS
jgi:brefeldin A-inhibited guanine nucleotide-exchange protein